GVDRDGGVAQVVDEATPFGTVEHRGRDEDDVVAVDVDLVDEIGKAAQVRHADGVATRGRFVGLAVVALGGDAQHRRAHDSFRQQQAFETGLDEYRRSASVSAGIETHGGL